jgi:hypothetical protein
VALLQYATREALSSDKALDETTQLSQSLFGEKNRVEQLIQEYKNMNKFDHLKPYGGLAFTSVAGVLFAYLIGHYRENNPNTPVQPILLALTTMVCALVALTSYVMVRSILTPYEHSRKISKKRHQQRNVPASAQRFVEVTAEMQKLMKGKNFGDPKHAEDGNKLIQLIAEAKL